MTTALYRRYRPDTFAQVIGQEHVTDPLRAALRANRVNHAYLFSGPRGCGKTTSARILARCLNCAEGPTDTPCGQCDSCRELATGGPGSLDVVEIDAASHGGVDDARDLRERATFAPVRDRYKVFIIDEAHMVSPQGFNALLKLVEEPPEHVKFVFATTEPERVIGTIRSRTHHYPFRLVPPDVLEPYLRQLCEEEQIRMGDGVLPLVMRAGGGSVRDSLSVLDQLMAGAIDGEVAYSTAVALLGYTDTALLDASVDALAGGDGAAAYRVVEKMVSSGHDPRRFVEDFLQRVRDLLIIAVAGDGAADVLVGTPVDQFERMQVQARNWGAPSLSRAADLADEALRSMTGATSPRLQLELLLGRILVPSPVAQVAPAEAGALPGTVGMAGGGAPRPAEASGSFGAREARERLARERREREQRQSAPTAGAAPVSQPAAPAFASSPERPAAAPVSSAAPSATMQTDGGPSGFPTAVPPGQSGSGAAQVTGVPAAVSSPSVASAGPASVPTPSVGSTGVPASAPVTPVGTLPADADSSGVSRAAPPEPSAPVVADAASAVKTPAPSGGSSAGGREADLLRQRWGDVVERLSSVSRVAWSLVAQNGQLGAVDGDQVVIVFPVAGMVAGFMNGGRGRAVEEAINEVVGLKMHVIAQVGQAGGGAPVTAPSAQTNRPEHAPAVPAPPLPTGEGYDWRQQEPPPFDQTAHEDTSREAEAHRPLKNEGHVVAPVGNVTALPEEHTGWPAPARPYEPKESPDLEGSSEPQGMSEPQGEFGFVPEPAASLPQNAENSVGEPSGWDVAPIPVPDMHVSPYAADDATFAADPASAVANDAAFAPASVAAGITDVSLASPTPQDLPASVPFSDSASSFLEEESADDSFETAAETDVPGNFADDASDVAQPDSLPAQAEEYAPVSWEPVAIPGGHAPEPFAAGETPDANPFAGEQPTGRTQAMNAADRAPEPVNDPYAPLTAPADDDTASIDDADMDTSTRYGIPAVLEILGGQIIEQVEDNQGGW